MAFFRFLTAHRALLVSIVGVLFVIGGTYLTIRWAKGYRPSLLGKGPRMTGTGLLVASSTPKGAQVFLNGKLTTATDDTMNLPPGLYDVEVQKEGYSPWKKKLAIITELVTQTNARLFPAVPNLTPLSFAGAADSLPSPDGQKIVYKVRSNALEAKNGLWVVDLANRNLPIARASTPRQIARNSAQYNFSISTLVWTPDSNQLLAYWEKKGTVTQATLLSVISMNDEASLRDITSRLPIFLSQWYEEVDLADQDRLERLPQEVREIATNSAASVFFSPDETKILYRATQKRTIPEHLLPDLPSESTQWEERTITPNGLYVYDLKEDKNYRIITLPSSFTDMATDDSSYWESRPDTDNNAEHFALPPIPEKLLTRALAELSGRYSPAFTLPVQWFPTSAHLLKRNDASISIIEYDGTNDVTVYAGPFDDSFVYPWPDGSKIIVLTNLSQSSLLNLYTITL